ncbi:MAG: sensor histidine kinase [Vitreoscilla sp.]
MPPVAMSGSLWRGILRRFDLRTLVIGGLIAAVLIVVGGVGLIGPVWTAARSTQLTRLVETAVTGFSIFIAVIVADELADRGARRVPTYAIAIIVAASCGAVLGWHVRVAAGLNFEAFEAGDIPGPMLNAAHRFAHHFGIALVCSIVGGLAAFAHVSRRTALAARQRQYDAERARGLAQRRTLESQLQALQARVEPMFLFDTLERIRLLYRSDAAAAGAMLEDLIGYLHAVLPHMRESSSTVAQEMQLARSWLDIVDRTARRWQLVVDIDAAVRHARLPALVLLPLVQRAVAGPGEGPARLQVCAIMDAGRLTITVATSTDAFCAGIAAIPVLEQIDERLRALHGRAASFGCLRSADAPGSRAVVSLPLEFGESDAGAAA